MKMNSFSVLLLLLLPPSLRISRDDRFDGGRPDERRNMAFGGGDRRHEPHGSYRQGYGSGMNDFDDRGRSRGRMDNRGGGFSPAHGGGGRGNGWEGGGGRSTYHDEPLYNHQGGWVILLSQECRGSS